MGQYYNAINADTLEALSPHDYENGAKLMESSYVGNNFVNSVCALLIPGAPWYKDRIVWGGDYMDSGLFGEDTADSLYNIATKIKSTDTLPDGYQYICNHTISKYVAIPADSDEDLIIHPLPILTCSDNGRGGGDYHGTNMDLVGIWAGNNISLEQTIPDQYTELIVNFSE